VPIGLPPLRERREDIPGLCELFCREVSRDVKIPPRRIGRRAIEKLTRYDFPGNIRELRNLIERAMILSSAAELGSADFPIAADEDIGAPANGSSSYSSYMASIPEAVNLREFLESIEKRLISRALESSDGVQAEAARRLSLSRSDLAYKLAKYQLTGDRE
jgi:DNA-binding NtrC family response regulator